MEPNNDHGTTFKVYFQNQMSTNPNDPNEELQPSRRWPRRRAAITAPVRPMKIVASARRAPARITGGGEAIND